MVGNVFIVREENKMSELSHGQQIALSHHLTEYPDDVSFAEICHMLEDSDFDDCDELVICDDFSIWETEHLIDMMTSLANDIDRVFVEEMEKKNDGQRPSVEGSIGSSN
jgi:hypothetical protein